MLKHPIYRFKTVKSRGKWPFFDGWEVLRMESDFDRRVLTVPDCTDFGSIPILTVTRVHPVQMVILGHVTF